MKSKTKQQRIKYYRKRIMNLKGNRTNSKITGKNILGVFHAVTDNRTQLRGATPTTPQRPVGRPRGSLSGRYVINGQIVDVKTYMNWVRSQRRNQNIRQAQLQQMQMQRYQQQQAQQMRRYPTPTPPQQQDQYDLIMNDTDFNNTMSTPYNPNEPGDGYLDPNQFQDYQQSPPTTPQQQPQQPMSNDKRDYARLSRVDYSRGNMFNLIAKQRPNFAYNPFLHTGRKTTLLHSNMNLMKNETVSTSLPQRKYTKTKMTHEQN